MKRGDTISRARDTNAESAPGARGTTRPETTRLGLVLSWDSFAALGGGGARCTLGVKQTFRLAPPPPSSLAPFNWGNLPFVSRT